MEFTKVIQRDTYDSTMEARNIHKFATNVAAEANLDDRIKGRIRTICSEWILQRFFGQKVSRHPRLKVLWGQMDSGKVDREGAFYSAIAEVVVKNPTLSEGIDKENLIDIAKSWRPGMEMTVEHAKGEAPELEDGVVIRPFEDTGDIGVDLSEVIVSTGQNGAIGEDVSPSTEGETGPGSGGPSTKKQRVTAAETIRRRNVQSSI